jgi:1-acyl-sn-glycerol-3-phosphate acyltransferase
LIYLLGYLLAKFVTHLLCRVTVEGREHIPDEGPFLAIGNHLSWIDPPLSISLMPFRFRITGIAARSHRKDPIIGWGMDKWGVIWVRRGAGDREALRQALDFLASGRPLGISPEGTRSKTGALIEGKTGVTFLALKADVPILPVTYFGTEKVFPNTRKLRRPPVRATIRPMFSLPPRGDSSRKEHMQYCTDLIMTRLASMLPESYRGVYTHHPLVAYWEHLDASDRADRPEWVTEPTWQG